MIKIDNLQKNYGNYSLNISMELEDGRITGLIGKNGAGKSTVIKSILGLIKRDGGSVLVDGKDSASLSTADKSNLGVALADSGFSVMLNLEAVSKILAGLYKDFDRQTFVSKCVALGLPEKKLIKEYSTGMKAKLRVLVALSHNAKILIMDEPTAGLDVEARNEILDILREYLIEDETRSILITSHIATDLEGLCDDLYLIDNGKIILHEETDVLLTNYGMLKIDQDTYEKMLANKENEYFLSEKRTGFGYECLTNEKQYFMDNYKSIAIENAGIDELILALD